jgi:hypothetical protein
MVLYKKSWVKKGCKRRMNVDLGTYNVPQEEEKEPGM